MLPKGSPRLSSLSLSALELTSLFAFVQENSFQPRLNFKRIKNPTRRDRESCWKSSRCFVNETSACRLINTESAETLICFQPRRAKTPLFLLTSVAENNQKQQKSKLDLFLATAFLISYIYVLTSKRKKHLNDFSFNSYYIL